MASVSRSPAASTVRVSTTAAAAALDAATLGAGGAGRSGAPVHPAAVTARTTPTIAAPRTLRSLSGTGA